MPIKLSYPLVETDWLAKNLYKADLRIIDCHYDIWKDDGKVALRSGQSAHSDSHIPNSIYIDLLKELSDPNTDLPFMQPLGSLFSDVMSRKGIGDDSAVILYDRDKSLWATRLWFMFREFGFNNVAVLNGGWLKWLNENRLVTTEPFASPPASFKVHPLQSSFFVNKEDVLDSLESSGVKRVCALDRESYLMKHIPGSINIDAGSLFDPERNILLPENELALIFDNAGLKQEDRIITYCGGSIAGSCVAFVLRFLGYKNVAIYDGSMEEWGRDPNLPVE